MKTRIPIDLPKVELHCHLEGTIPPALAIKIAKRNKIKLSDSLFHEDVYAWDDFTSFLKAYDNASLCLRNANDYREITYSYLKACASEGTIYVEVFVSPYHAVECGISYNELKEGIIQAFDDAEHDFGIIGRAIVTCVRHLGPERAMEVANTFLKDKHPYFVGFGMAGDEGHLSFVDFKPVFDHVAESGYPCTVHAGEHYSAATVLEAIDTLPVTRIGHGVRLVEDTNAVETVSKSNIVLEICPSSNIALGLYPDHKSHPFMKLYEAGCKVTLNSDDPPYFDTSIGHEYANASTEFGLSTTQLLNVTRTALDAAFIDKELRAKLHARIDAWETKQLS